MSETAPDPGASSTQPGTRQSVQPGTRQSVQPGTRQSVQPSTRPNTLRLATWNVNSVKARLPRLLAWLADQRPDVLCLQETKVADEAFPTAEVAELGYASAVHGQGRWNGVALLSRVGLEDVTRGFAGDPGWDPAASDDAGEAGGGAGDGAGDGAGGGAGDDSAPEAVVSPASRGPLDVADTEARAISATCAGVRVWSVYVPNGRSPDSAHYKYKLNWLSALGGAIATDLERHGPVVVCGDFNVAPTDADVWDPAAFVGATHVTAAERDALAALRGLGLDDIVPTPMKGPNPFTYWDYRAGMFHQDMGMRIDLVYASPAVTAGVRAAFIDREARKGKAPSDHAPVIIDFDL